MPAPQKRRWQQKISLLSILQEKSARHSFPACTASKLELKKFEFLHSNKVIQYKPVMQVTTANTAFMAVDKL